MSVVERCVLGIVRARSACSYPSDVRCVRRIAVLSLDWLDSRVVQIDYEVLVYGVLIRRFGVTNGLHDLVHSSSLRPTMVRCDSVVLAVLLVILKVNAFVRSSIVLNGIIVD